MNTQSEVNGKSPYVKYKKRPYVYSDELNNWTAAIKKGDKASADRHDRAWRKRFAPETQYRPRRDDAIDEFLVANEKRMIDDDWNHSDAYR